MDNSKKYNCPSCGSENFNYLFSAEDYLVSNEKYDIKQCTKCSLRVTFPIPDSEGIMKYYRSEDYISHKESGKSIINKIYKVIQKIALVKKRRIIWNTFGSNNGKLLDIGCGTGDFLQFMKKSGWDITGVEPDKNARLIAEELTSCKILTEDEHFYDSTKYDVITMWHSLEHVHDLDKQIIQIGNLLNDNGILFIAVPNYTSLDADYYQQNWAAYDVPRHLYHFSPQVLQELFKKYGYKIIGHKQLPFDPFYISLLSELSVLRTKNVIRAVWIGFRSYLRGLWDSGKSSSVLYILEKE